MFSKITISKNNLLHNINLLKSKQKHLCVMVKANAYGNGLKQVVRILSGNVDAFGVSNLQEALLVRKLDKQTPVILFGNAEDYVCAIQNGISLTITSCQQLQRIANAAKRLGMQPRLNLNINTGMNRYGIKTQAQFDKVIKMLTKQNLDLEGVFTHFSTLTSDEDYLQKQKNIFDCFVSQIPKNLSPIVCVGGGNAINKLPGYDLYRVGMFVYGYGMDGLKPVMQVQSQIVQVQDVKAGEYVGYLCSFKATQDMRVGVVPLGYADGLKRGLSNKLQVKINKKTYTNVGNICMDCFMVQIDKSVKVGRRVVVMDDAAQFAKILSTTEYEVLTNFNSFRGKREVK